MLLLAIYLGGMSIGNHLLALLVGPALVTFLVVTARREPIADLVDRLREWAEVAVVAGIWMLLIGTGLGNTALVFLGAMAFGAALVLAIRRRSGSVRRPRLHPRGGRGDDLPLPIYQGRAAALHQRGRSVDLAVTAGGHPSGAIRDQNAVRRSDRSSTGPENTGRTLQLIGLQLLNYVQYFDWQWAKSLSATLGGIQVRTGLTLLFLWLGIRGFLAQRRADRGTWWLLTALFLTTGLGLVAYMNFKPGFSVGVRVLPQLGRP